MRGSRIVPIVTVEMLEGRTVEQKRELAKAITEDIVNILQVKPDDVTVIYHELPRSNLAKAGALRSDQRY